MPKGKKIPLPPQRQRLSSLTFCLPSQMTEGNKKTASFGDGFQTVNSDITNESIRVNRQILSFIHSRD